jgi:UPF0755 protein
MDENNQPQQDWRDALMSLNELPEDSLPATPEPILSGDTQPLPNIADAVPSQTAELDRIMQELQAMEQEQEDHQPAVEPEAETFKDDDFRDTFGEGEDLLHVFRDEATPPIPEQKEEPEPEQEKEEEGPVEKGRPKRKKGYGLFGLPHLAATAVWVIIILTIGISIGRLGWLCASDVLALGREPICATVVVEEGDSLNTIANKLKEAGLIKYPGIFKLYADFTNADEKIRPGSYFFSDVNEQKQSIVYDYMALVAVMAPSGNRLEVVEDLRIPEGATCAQIFKLLEEKGVCKAEEMESFIASLHLPAEGEEPDPLTQYWFLEGVQWGDRYSLEGYLFPDTYDFYVNDDPERVVKKMLEGFDHAFTDIMRANLEKVEGHTIRDIIIIASMIEKEAASASESFTISSVIFNRLAEPANYPYLNIDATIVYALGGKSELTKEDLEIDHPYNTYKYKGLPPGAISNPSQNSIAAALTPEETLDDAGKPVKYYYYALNPATNLHKFSKTLKEHQAFLDSLKKEDQ